MRSLLKHELMKIVKSPMCLIGAIVLFVVMVTMVIASLSSASSYDENGNSLSDIQAIRREKELFERFDGKAYQDIISETIVKYNAVFSDKDNLNEYGFIRDDVYITELYPYHDFISAIASIYTSAGMPTDFSAIKNLSYQNGQMFYYMRNFQINEYLNFEYSYGNFTDSEKEYINDMNSKVETPFKYSYRMGWENIIGNLFPFFIVLTFVACSMISPIFSNEFQTGAAQIILSSKNGIKKIFHAKILALFVFSTAVFVMFTAIFTLMFLAVYGTEGYDNSVQVLYMFSVYNVTIGEAFVIILALAYTAFIEVMMLTAMISACMKNNFAVILISAAVLFTPLFIPDSKTSRGFNYFIDLLPTNIFNGFEALRGYKLYEFFGTYLQQPIVMVAFSVAVIVLAVVMARLAYGRQQVKN